MRVHFFVARMSYSRRIFAKSYFSENQVNWLDGIESAFRFFDGVPREIVCDNAKTLVKDHYAPENERFAARFDWFCQYHGVHPIATSVRKPNSKGKVESAVRYIKHNALVNGRFKDLEALNCHLERWSLFVCDRHHIKDPFLQGPKTPAERWMIEKPALRPNRKPPTAMAHYEERTADKNGLIRSIMPCITYLTGLHVAMCSWWLSEIQSQSDAEGSQSSWTRPGLLLQRRMAHGQIRSLKKRILIKNQRVKKE